MRRDWPVQAVCLLFAFLLLTPPSGLAYGQSVEPVDTTPPTVPTGLHVTHTTYEYIAMAWNPNTEPDLDRYEIYRSRWCGVGVGFWHFVDQVKVGNAYVDQGVLSECVYAYYIVAVDTSENYSLPSNQLWAESYPDGLLRVYLPLLPALGSG